MLLILFLGSPIFASDQYTLEEVVKHNVVENCWMVYEERVYDITSYLPLHDQYLNIREWCGTEMTIDFQTKVGIGEDHKGSSYDLLSQYYIGMLVSSIDNQPPEEVGREVVDTIIPSTSPYNLPLPFLLSLFCYWVPYFFIKNKKRFNAFWNTILLLTLLIPSFGFGIFMILRYRFPSFYDIDFNFMYWHVELSIVMGVLGISHLVQRLKLYLVQLRK